MNPRAAPAERIRCEPAETPRQHERAVLAGDARVRLRTEVRLIGRRRRDPELRQIGRRAGRAGERHGAGHRRAGRENDVKSVENLAVHRVSGCAANCGTRCRRRAAQNVAPRRDAADRDARPTGCARRSSSVFPPRSPTSRSGYGTAGHRVPSGFTTWPVMRATRTSCM